MLCFVCLQNSEETLAIFGEEGVEYNIPGIVEKHLNVKPQLVDETCEICGQCWGKLSDFHEYYQCVAEAHLTLKSKSHLLLEEEDENDEEDNTLSDIKEEFLDESPKNNLEAETEDIFTENPFLELEAEGKGGERNVKIKKKIKRKSVKRGKTKAQLKRKRANITKEHSTEEEEECEDLKTLTSLLDEFKNEENASAEDGKSTKCPTTDGSSRTQTANETRRRKGHVLLEENEEIIKKHIQMLCQMCPHSSDEFQDLIKHFKEQHPGVKPHIKCCERKLDCPSDILQHAYYHEDPDYFKCSDCDKRFINNSGLRDHYLQYHEPEENLPYGCDQCQRRFSRKNLLEHHKSKHVPKTERSHYCEICKPTRAFANEYILQLHIKNRHTKATNICHVCAKEIRDKQAFEKHVRLHFETSGPRLKCPREGCDSWLKDKDNLKQHLRRFHDARQYECPVCGRICKNKHSLTCHLKNTHTTKNYICEECHKNFKSQQSLKEHMAGHTGEPLYNCPFCTRTFNSKANMYSHKKKSHPKEWELWNKSRMGST